MYFVTFTVSFFQFIIYTVNKVPLLNHSTSRPVHYLTTRHRDQFTIKPLDIETTSLLRPRNKLVIIN